MTDLLRAAATRVLKTGTSALKPSTGSVGATASAPVEDASGKDGLAFGTPTAPLRPKLQPSLQSLAVLARDRRRRLAKELAAKKTGVAPTPLPAKPPVDVNRPFDAAAEAKAIDEAIAGGTNHWSVLNQVLSEDLQAWGPFIKEAVKEITPDHVDEVYVCAFAAIVEAHLGRSEQVKRYVGSLKDPVARGAIFQGYVDEIAVPDGKSRADFRDLKGFLSTIQSKRGLPSTFAGKVALAALTNTLGATPRGRSLLRSFESEKGLGFNRMMLTPFAYEDGMDGGYSQIDPNRVDPRFGGDEAHVEMMEESILRQFEIIADQIDNHCSVLHERVQELKNGDLDRLKELVNWSGAAKVGERTRDGQQFNIIVHAAGESAGAVSEMWSIFPDSNPDSLFRLQIPLKGKWLDLDETRKLVGDAVALDDEAKAAVQKVYEHFVPSPGPDGRYFLPKSATAVLGRIREANTKRVFARLEEAKARGETPTLEVDLVLSFMGNIQYDKNLADPRVLRECFAGLVKAGKLGQSGTRFDAIIHAGKVPGTDQLNQPLAKAYLRLACAMTHLITPGRVVIPEAFLPPEVINRDYLSVGFEVGGKKVPVMGDLAIAFASATNNTSSIRTEKAAPFANYVKERLRVYEGALGNLLAYPCRLHDEALLTREDFEALVESGQLVDPFLKVDALAAEYEARGEKLDTETAFSVLRHELENDATLTNFANRAAGDDASVVLGSPERVAQSLALTYAGPDIPAVSSRILVGAGNSVDFALERARQRIELQLESGEEVNFRKAFDARDLGRGPIPKSLWEQRIAEKYAPVEMVRALNTLWSVNPSVRTREMRVLDNDNEAVVSFARGEPGTDVKPLLQLFNVSSEAQTVRLPKSVLARELGWDSAESFNVTDLLQSEMEGQAVRMALRDAGDHVELELAPNQSVYLQRPADARIGWLQNLVSAARRNLESATSLGYALRPQ